MKPITAIACGLTLAAAAFFSCTKDTVTETYTFYRPVYETSDAARNGIKSAAPQAVTNPGKLAVKGHYLYLTELGKGVHIIDYSNPRAPENMGFVAVPGNADIAVRGNYLYADCYTALAVIDISTPESVKLQSFVNRVFPDRFSGLSNDTGKMIVKWEKVDTVISRKFSESFDKTLDGSVLVYNDAVKSYFSSSPGGGVSNSTGGSMARFALVDDRMYVVGLSDLKVFNTVEPAAPVYVKTTQVGMGIETIFPFKNNLFIGSQTGMFIYNIDSKDNPALKGTFTHARNCDPVVADDKHAYVTLRTGTFCAGNLNQLDVLDITTITSPSLVKTYSMTNPHGLAKEGSLLFICDGADGLKIYNAEKPGDIKQVGALKDIFAYDIIPLNGVALLSAQNAFYFVDYTNPANPAILSQLSITK